jgi:MSHA biogenesis protein MshK
MAKRLNVLRVCVAAALMAQVAEVPAETLPDPTRPPPVLGAIPGTAQAGVPSSAAGPLLQSVLISPNRKSAIIGGKTVGIGDRYGDAQVVGIGEGEVVLKSGNRLHTLRLFPGVEKRKAK